MRLPPAALALALLLSHWALVTGVSLESLLTNKRCKCVKSTSQVVPLGMVLAIDVLAPGIYCRRKEIILSLKRNKKVCVAPEAPWIQVLLHRLTQRNASKKAVAPVPRQAAEQQCAAP